mmetsp:Transcript_25713/g.65345  ORF Transcript_25713/g.65345 Transcript_25713/m.65345 type:complete len:207 (+) Transcript_25713:2374-2994(+)
MVEPAARPAVVQQCAYIGHACAVRGSWVAHFGCEECMPGRRSQHRRFWRSLCALCCWWWCFRGASFAAVRPVLMLAVSVPDRCAWLHARLHARPFWLQPVLAVWWEFWVGCLLLLPRVLTAGASRPQAVTGMPEPPSPVVKRAGRDGCSIVVCAHSAIQAPVVLQGSKAPLSLFLFAPNDCRSTCGRAVGVKCSMVVCGRGLSRWD